MKFPTEFAIDAGVKAAIGLTIGTLSKTNSVLWATILATHSLAFYLFNSFAQKSLKEHFRTRTIEDFTRAATYLGMITLLKIVNLISLRTAGLLGFFTFTFLLTTRHRRFERVIT